MLLPLKWVTRYKRAPEVIGGSLFSAGIVSNAAAFQFVAHGKVSRIWNSSSYGPNAVRVQSTLNGKLYNVDYGHMSSQNVWVGQSVRAGETIGQIGRLGNAFTGGSANLWPTHVHISVWRPIVEGNSWYRGFVQPWW